MREIGEQTPLRFHQSLNAAGHGVEGRGKLAYFVTAGGGDAHFHVARAKTVHHVAQFAQRLGEMVREPEAEETHRGEHPEV